MTKDIFKSIYSKIPSNIKTCFITGMVAGWITHFYMLTHKIPNWDDITQIMGLGLTNAIGRWMLEPLQYIGQRASNPAIHGMLLIFFISVAACFVIASLKLKSTTSAVIVPIMMVTFPSITGVLYFMFTAHLYALSILMFCASAYLMQKYKYGFIASGVCITLALAIYQPFVSISITLFVLMLILNGFRGERLSILIKQGIIDACTLGASTFVYIRIAHLIYPAMETTTYGGAGQMGKIALSDIPKNFARVYKRVLEYFVIKPFAYLTPSMCKLNIIICLFLAIVFIYGIIETRLWTKRLELAFVALMTFLFPFAIGFVYFMAPGAPFSALMIYAYLFVYVFLVSMLEIIVIDGAENGKRFDRVVWSSGTVVMTLSLLLIGYFNYLLDSQAYFRSEIAVGRATNYYNRIISRVESTEGFNYGDRVVLLGSFYHLDNPSPIEIRIFNDDDGFRELSGVVLENGLITSGVRSNFIRTYIGFDAGVVTFEEQEKIKQTKQFREMPDYPAEGSIEKIEDVWVVKLCE